MRASGLIAGTTTTRVPVGTPTYVLLYALEVVDRVPTAAHDRPVTAAVTPEEVIRLGAAG